MTMGFLRTPWRMNGSSPVDCADASLVGRFCLGTDSKDWPALIEAVNAGANIEAARQDAFELGVKSAGGSIIPDRSGFVEIALTREQIEVLASFADNVVEDPADRNHDSAPCLRAFLDIVSIYRSRK